jgi:hypothetical protein
MVGICFSDHEVNALMRRRLSKILRPITRVVSSEHRHRVHVGKRFLVRGLIALSP